MSTAHGRPVRARNRFLRAAVTATMVAIGIAACRRSTPSEPTNPQVLFRDDFDGSALDGSKWFLPSGIGTFLGRTQIRPPSEALDVANGTLRLQLDTHNPTALVPGDSFWGSEIVSHQVFVRQNGLLIRARTRLTGPLTRGLVGSVFLYAPSSGVRDEIDFELLSNDAGRVLTNLFDDDGFSVPGRPEFVSVPGLDLAAFNEYELEWRADRLRWRVNGQQLREVTSAIPEAAMTVRLNFWAAAADFSAAFDAGFQPASRSQDNQRFFYEVDFVEVRAF